MRHGFRPLALVVAVLFGLAAFLGARRPAAAAEEEKAVAVKVEGPEAVKIREIIVELMPEGVEVLDDAEFSRGLARMGLPGGKIGFAMTNPRQKPILLKVVAKTVGAAGLKGAVLARIRAVRGIELMIIYHEAQGDPVIDTAVPLKGGREEWKEAIRGALAPVLDELAPPAPEPEPEPAPEPERKPKKEPPKQEEPEEEEDEGPGYEPNRIGSEVFSLFAGVEFGGRFFSYSESIANSPQTRPYDVFGTPGIHVGGELYPVATEEVPFISDLGLTVSYMHAFGLSSETSDGRFVFDSSYNRLWAGLVYRIRLADRNELPVVINLSGRFGMLNYAFEPRDATATEIDDEVAEVGYLLVRPGLDLRIPAGSVFAMMPSFGYLGTLKGGEVYDRFRDATVHGVDMGFAFAFVIDSGFEIRGGFEYTRFFSAFAPEPTDAYVAGGALDQFLALRLATAYVF